MSDLAPGERPPGARRAARSSRFRVRLRPSRGTRIDRPRGRRTRSLGGTVGMTLLGALVPGSGYLYAGRRALGAVVLLGWAAIIGALVWYFGRDLHAGLELAFDPARLKVAIGVLAVGLVTWALIVFTSHRLVRMRDRRRWQTVTGNVAMVLVIAVVGAPVVRAGQYLQVTASSVDTIFAEAPKSPTVPDLEQATEKDPWAGKDRVNVLLLGGDYSDGRTGVRTDTVILASMDTHTGKTVTFSLPRNMRNAQFPADSPLHDIYPDGFGYGGTEDPGFYMLNAIYGQVPERHPGVLGDSDNEGADAIKQAVAGSLGIPVDYYLLVNLKGFQEVVDAMGGITVNINEPVAINGDTSAGIPPTGYLQPGPDQHLDGFHALWYARGRYGSDDYARMDRQRCAVDALIEAADPVTLLTNYIDLAKAGKEILYTDIPRKLGPAFVELLLQVKNAKTKTVVFKSSDEFYSGDPDFDYVHEVVQKALEPGRKRTSSTPSTQKVAQDPTNACAYTGDDLSAAP